MPSKIKTNNAEQLETIGVAYDMEIKKSSQHHTSKSGKEKNLSSSVSKNLKLRDNGGGSRTKKPINRLYTDLCPAITQDINAEHSGPPKSSWNYQNKQYEKKATKAEELVKYMSNVPCYLQQVERGDNVQGKALNFGVLDWGRLEKWKYNQKLVPSERSLHSQSSSNTSSPFSTFGSSTQSCRSDSGFLTQKKKSYAMNSHLNLAVKEGLSQTLEAKPSGCDLKISYKSDPLPEVNESIGKNYLDSKHENGRRKGSVSKVASRNTHQPPEMGILSSHSAKKILNDQDGNSKFRTEQNQELGFDNFGQHCHGSFNIHDFDSARDQPQDSCPGLFRSFEGMNDYLQQRDLESHLSFESRASDDGRLSEAIRTSDSDQFHFKDIYFDALSLDVPHSCPLPCEVQSSELSDMKLPIPAHVPGTKISSDVCCSYQHSDEIPNIQCEENHAKKNMSPIKPTKLFAVDPSDRLVSEKAKADTGVGRNPSSNCQSGLNMVRKSSTFKEGVPSAQQSNSMSAATKFGLVKLDASASLDNFHRDKANAGSRARQSPLRRMLDPLLKPMLTRQFSGSTTKHSREFVCTPELPFQEESKSTDGRCKSSNAKLNSLSGKPVKRNLNRSSWVSANTNGSPIDKKSMALTMHAFLQLAWKNGLPLYTFSANNDHDILVATMRKISSSGKDDFDCIYTFHGIKKRNGGWLHQGSKSKKQGLIPNVVGHMKVSCSESPKLTSCDSKDHFMVREFVLFGVEQRQAVHETSEFLPSSELAAIIVDVPKVKQGSFSGNGWNGDNSSDLLGTELTKGLTQERRPSHPAENQQVELNIESQSHSNIVAILPGGVHGLPVKDGTPSPLLDRWRSGGSCDCGGWDVGCTLTILSSQDQQSKSLSTSQECFTSDENHHVRLFLQGGTEENKHVFSMAALEEEHYSVDFNASFSLLQASSICIAMLHSRKPLNLSKVCKLLDLKTSQEPVSTQDQRANTPTKTRGAVPASYVPYPPHSPVGRV